jgi:beta-glucosidase
LLKNEDNLLPIDISKKLSIAVIGENATKSMTIGGGSSELKANKEILPIEGIKEKFVNATIKYAKGYSSEKSDKNIILKKEALKISKNADIVLFFGGLNKNNSQDSENSDRLQYKLPYGQDELIKELSKVNENLAIILISGNAVETSWKSNVKSIIQSWYLGSESGNALAAILSGEINPSGKLPFSFPKKLKDNGAHYYGELSYPGNGISQYYKEDILVGYRWHDTKRIDPEYPFGYGLSYTKFNLFDVATNKRTYQLNDTIIINCKVKNIGEVNGKEVVQVYVGKYNSNVKRALKELKGFEKVSLTQGETKQINISIDAKDLAYYNEETSNWVVEKGDYIIYVGNGSKSISKELKITII